MKQGENLHTRAVKSNPIKPTFLPFSSSSLDTRSFFTIDSLDNQIRVYNLTKYTQPHWQDLTSYPINSECYVSGDPSHLDRAKILALHAITSPCSYIPPHCHATNTPFRSASNPNQYLEPKSSLKKLTIALSYQAKKLKILG